MAVRPVVPDAAVYVLAGLLPGTAGLLAAADLRPVLGSWPEIEGWAAFRPGGRKPPAAIHVDTGMNRLGLSLNEALHLARQAKLLDAIRPCLVMSHLACADLPDHPRNAEQAALFAEVRALFPGIPASLANSAGIHLGPDYRFDLVRPGIALYGGAYAATHPPLEPVVTAEARILQLRDADAGETVGYGAAETLRRPTRLAIVAAGYADGYHRLAGTSDQRPGARASVRGRSVPLVGRVSMDLLALDVTGIPGVSPGDWVELIGPNAPLEEVAAAAGTIGYELLTALGRRYARRYRGGREARLRSGS
jgi:alanine racemase